MTGRRTLRATGVRQPVEIIELDEIVEAVVLLCNEARWEEARVRARRALEQRSERDESYVRLALARVKALNDEDWTRGLVNRAEKYRLLDEIDTMVEAIEDGYLRGHALFQRGMALHIDFCMADGDLDRELECFTQSADLLERCGDVEGAADAIAFVGIFHHVDRLDPDTGRPYLLRAYEMAPTTGGSHAKYEASRHLGQIQHECGDPEGALPLLTESLDLCAEAGRSRGLVPALHALGAARMDAGDLDGAVRDLDRATDIGQRYGCRYFLSFVQRTRAELEFRRMIGASRRGNTYVSEIAPERLREK